MIKQLIQKNDLSQCTLYKAVPLFKKKKTGYNINNSVQCSIIERKLPTV